MILIDISGASAVIRKQDVLTQGMAGATVTFRFDSSWDGFSKTAVFRGGDITKDVTDIADTVTIPWEVLLAGVPVCIGVYGIKGEIVLPTVWVRTNPVQPGADPSGDESADPTLPIWAEMQKTVNSIREDADAGKFNGPPGPKGDAGAIEFVVVTELPAVGDTSKIYLLPEFDGEEPNRFGEYVFIEGAWERIGSAGVEVNLEEYVKNTDFATLEQAGVVKINPAWGISRHANGRLKIDKATDAKIAERADNFLPIVPSNLDYAVKKALADSKLAETVNAWTDEEKAAARQLLGAVGTEDFADALGEKAGIVRLGGYGAGGLTIRSNGTLGIQSASISLIKSRSDDRPLSSAEIENALWAGVTGYKEVWDGGKGQMVGSYGNQKQLTDEEKGYALQWLGVSDLITGLTAKIQELEAKINSQ